MGQGRDTPVEGTCSLYPFHASIGYPSFCFNLAGALIGLTAKEKF